MIAPSHIAPAVHPREEERLKALRLLKVLDTQPEERYDRITRLASEVFGVPIAYVSLVDENRQWFKSSHGMKLCQTSRNESFCGHAILGDDTLVIPDATLDSRFATNPMVVGEPYIRFYAGHPLRNVDNLPMGTLCLIDHTPRKFDNREKQMLKELGAMVEDELRMIDAIGAQGKLIQTQSDLISSQDRLHRELAAGARYVESLLPKPLRDNRIAIIWHFQPSEQLGGDAFHYYWLNDDTFVFFMLDVAGHGLEAALLSVSVLDTLRNRSLAGIDFADPNQVLRELNRLYAMSEHDNMYFTLWYGVYKASDRSLHYATGGHPQAILWRQKPERSFQLLGQPGHLVGAFRNINYENVSFRLEKGDRLDLFSDGLYEAIDGTGNRWSVQDLGNFLKGQKESLNSREVVEAVQKHRNLEAFQDNVTLLQIVFK